MPVDPQQWPNRESSKISALRLSASTPDRVGRALLVRQSDEMPLPAVLKRLPQRHEDNLVVFVRPTL